MSERDAPPGVSSDSDKCESVMSLSPVFDHVAINVRERLDESVDMFTRLGFSLTPRGYHSMGSANHLAMFATDYLELLGLPANSTVVRRDLLEWPCGING